jgi:hypothetical protein
VRKIFPIFLWFFSLIFSHQILVHRPCHDSYLCPQTEWGDTTFILPTRTSTESNVCKGKVRKVSFPYFFTFCSFFHQKVPPVSHQQSYPCPQTESETLLLSYTSNTTITIESRGQGRAGEVRFSFHVYPFPSSLLIS